jgi:hypothetical protein
MFTGRRWVIFKASQSSEDAIELKEFLEFLHENVAANNPVQTLKTISSTYGSFQPLSFTAPVNHGPWRGVVPQRRGWCHLGYGREGRRIHNPITASRRQPATSGSVSVLRLRKLWIVPAMCLHQTSVPVNVSNQTSVAVKWRIHPRYFGIRRGDQFGNSARLFHSQQRQSSFVFFPNVIPVANDQDTMDDMAVQAATSGHPNQNFDSQFKSSQHNV